MAKDAVPLGIIKERIPGVVIRKEDIPKGGEMGKTQPPRIESPDYETLDLTRHPLTARKMTPITTV